MGTFTKAMKRADAVLGRLAVHLLPRPLGAGVAARRHSFLVIRPGGIGDAVLLIPALLALKERYPQAVVTVLAERRNAAVFALCGAVDRLLLYERPRHLLAAIRAEYDVVIDSEQWHRLSAVVSRLCGARVSVGFATNERSRLFSCPIAYSHEDYEMDSFFHLLAPLGIEARHSLAAPFLSVPEPAARRVAEILEELRGIPFVAIFPGASIIERPWGGGRFREVAGRLSARGLSVVAVGGAGDMAEAELIVSGVPGGLNLAGKCSLAESAAVIQRSRLLLTGDSGLLHIAVGLGVPTVSLFGPGIQAKWGPKGKDHRVLSHWLPCSPCTRFGTTPPCPIKARCLSQITVDEVVSAVEAQLQLGEKGDYSNS